MKCPEREDRVQTLMCLHFSYTPFFSGPCVFFCGFSRPRHMRWIVSYTHGNNVKLTVTHVGVFMPSHSDALACSLNENIYFYYKQRKDQDYGCVHMYNLFSFCVYLLRSKGFKLFSLVFFRFFFIRNFNFFQCFIRVKTSWFSLFLTQRDFVAVKSKWCCCVFQEASCLLTEDT